MGRGLAFKVVLGGADVGVAHEFLDIVELVTGLFKPKGEGGTQGMGRGALGHACGANGGGDGPPNTAGVQVMPLDRQGAGSYGEVTGGEDILPFLGCFGPGVFAG